ncbi:hypothetical protein BDZ89DRAFT_1065936 [Hymenopellis radicata]|nr:hypothetical protein BDZ89DRAFT_1065936 [Hymenopellis radicata]
MGSANVVFVLLALTLASHALPMEDRCHLPAHLRPLSCDSQNDKRQAGFENAVPGLGKGIKLPKTKNRHPPPTTRKSPPPPTTRKSPPPPTTRKSPPPPTTKKPPPPSTTKNTPPETDRPASSITKATPTKTSSPSATKATTQTGSPSASGSPKTESPSSTKSGAQSSKTGAPSSTKADSPSGTLTSANPDVTADVPSTGWKPKLDAAGKVIGYFLDGTNTVMTVLEYNKKYGGGGESLSAEPSGTLSVDPNATIDPEDGASVTAATEGEPSATAEAGGATGNPDTVPGGGDTVERRAWKDLQELFEKFGHGKIPTL